MMNRSYECHVVRQLQFCIWAFLALASSGCAGVAALDRQAQGSVGTGSAHVETQMPMTLPRFLGVDTLARRTALVAQLTRERAATIVPALEPKPLALPLSHPSHEESASPAVANAHKVKKAKAAKVAKIKAVAALGREDCVGDPLVEEGILAALDDPAAEVRIKAIEAVMRSRRGCDNCCNSGCCSLPIRSKLTEIVFEKTGPNCWLEPSSKARRLARLALDNCGGPAPTNNSLETVSAESPAIEIVDMILGNE